jgi:ATP-dependent RNA helicase RhlB
MEFSELNLHPDLQRGISDAGYINCMPVQEQVLANAFNGQDLYVQSQTGTGKTAAFLVVIFQRLLSEPLLGGRKAITMVPTRELAVQVEEEAKILGKYLPFKVGSFYGGVGYTQQQKMLRENVQILVGTPGRVLDLNKSGYMNLMDIAFLVIDEADRMFDMGFYPDLRKLIKVVPPADRRQTMLFSATLNSWVKNLAWEYTKTPHEIAIEPETVTVDEVDQVLYHVESENKMKLLMGIMEREKPESAIIFCNTKRYAEIVAKRLRVNGFECEFIMGDLPQTKRQHIIDDVKAGRVRFLVATDVAARGLDIEGLSMVVNYDLPIESENYVHRIGRTARAGKTGKAITLASEQDVYELPDIEKYIGKKIPSLIAGKDLLGEDKSEGLRIRTDFYDDRRDSRSRERRPAGGGRSGDGRSGRTGSPRRDSSRMDASTAGAGRAGRPEGNTGRPAAERSAPGEGRTGGRRGDRTGGGRSRAPAGGRSGSAGAGVPAGTGAPDRNLSQLSLEERMAYYKEKYAGTPDSGPNTRNREAPNREGRSGSRGNRSGSGGRGQRDQRTGRNADSTESSAGKVTAPGAAAEPGAQKPGLFGKLLGAFKRKPR